MENRGRSDQNANAKTLGAPSSDQERRGDVLNNGSEPDAEIDALATAVIGAAIEVHRKLGPGLDEAMYGCALCVEFRLRNIAFVQQVIFPVSYKGESIGEKRLDFVVGRKLIVELNAVDQLISMHKAQVLTYLKITGLKLGLLINFNTSLLKEGIKRIIQT